MNKPISLAVSLFVEIHHFVRRISNHGVNINFSLVQNIWKIVTCLIDGTHSRHHEIVMINPPYGVIAHSQSPRAIDALFELEKCYVVCIVVVGQDICVPFVGYRITESQK